MLLNLLSNAFKFTPDGGRVRLSLVSRSGQLAFEVADSGPGIPEDQRDVVFEAFRRLDRDVQHHLGGTGLGLAITRDFVALHGGSIQVGQAAEGGALFTVTLPLKAPPDVPVGEHDHATHRSNAAQLALGALQPKDEPHQPTDESTKGPLILVVEDNPDMNLFLCDSLRREGYRTVPARNGQEGLDKAQISRPDLIVTDIMMPVMSGDEMISRLRELPTLSDTPVVVLSAKADDSRTRSISCTREFLFRSTVVRRLSAVCRRPYGWPSQFMPH